MTESNISIKRYSHQHYTALFDKSTGILIRIEDAGFKEPFWCHSGPELLDISITNWCDKYCEICYRNSNENGKHMRIVDYESILVQASQMGVFQVALGGGNPNQHPNFCDILELTKEKYGIIPSYTTNGRGLSKTILKASKKYCGAVAISYYEPIDEFIYSLELLKSMRIRTNIHYVISSTSIKQAIEWLESIPIFLKGINAIIFLNYKATGDKKDNNLLLNHNNLYKKFFDLLNSNTYPFKIGFDSCSISGIVSHMSVDSVYLDPCESARFSAFISEDLMMFPCSFMINNYQGISLREHSIHDVWQKGNLFNVLRSKLRQKDITCSNCLSFESCLGGCPIFDNLSLCSFKHDG
ncbi:MAG: radical SAM protein [Erysipelotrichaceae bacterium]|jgi:radical SAM protein with 4Fe4S-binding SPASM domain